MLQPISMYFMMINLIYRGHTHHLRIQEGAGRRKTQSQVGRLKRGGAPGQPAMNEFHEDRPLGDEKININQTRMGLYLHYKGFYGMEDNFRLDDHSWRRDFSQWRISNWPH